MPRVYIIKKEAPDGLDQLPPADCILIGGSGGRLAEILEVSLNQLRPHGRIVLNAITIETLQQSLTFAQDQDLSFNVITLAVSRLENVGASHLWKALNPVNIITLQKKAEVRDDR